MTTTFVSLSLEALKDDLVEFINDENLDMLDKFDDNEIADFVLAIASRLLLTEKAITIPLTSCGGIKNYQFKVNNEYRGFVFCSDEDTGDAGVSRTMYFPFFKDEDGYFAGLCCLASMVNEAWYHCNN